MEIGKTVWGPRNFSGGLKDVNSGRDKADFGRWLAGKLAKVDKLQKQADTAARDMITGRNTSLHETMLAMQKAEISFKLLMEVRNKLISAYEEIQRMQF